MKLLHIQSGIFGDHSQSNALSNQFIDVLREQDSHLEVVTRDLVASPIPHLDAEIITALSTASGERNEAQQQIVDFSDQLIEEIVQADAIVLGVPMYNFGVPSQLKAYFDQIARAGVTFKYTETGPVGLLEDKPVYVLAARGGLHKDQPTDSQTGFLKTILGFVGLQNVQIIYAEGLNMGDAAKAEALQQAEQAMKKAVA